MNQHTNLRVSHRLLYRQSLILGIAALINGIGLLFFPQLFFGSYVTLKAVAIAPIWGVLWSLSALSILGGLTRLPYAFVRTGLVGLTTLFFTWAVGILTNQLFNVVPYALLAIPVYGSLAAVCITMLLEPPINPETAIRTGRGND